MINKIKNARVGLSQIEISTEGTTNSKVFSFAEQVDLNIKLGRAWLGEALKGLGNPYPYETDANRKSVEDIKPAADVSEEIIVVNVIDVERNSKLRENLDNLITGLEEEKAGKEMVDYPVKVAVEHFKNARIFLGFILGNVRETTSINDELIRLYQNKKPQKTEIEQIAYLKAKLSKLGAIIDVE